MSGAPRFVRDSARDKADPSLRLPHCTTSSLMGPQACCAQDDTANERELLPRRNEETDLLLRRDELVGDGEQGQLKAGGNAGLVEDVRQVALHGLLAERELFGNIAITAAFHDAAHHLEFAGGEAVGLALRRRACCIRSCRAETRFTTRLPPIQ